MRRGRFFAAPELQLNSEVSMSLRWAPACQSLFILSFETRVWTYGVRSRLNLLARTNTESWASPLKMKSGPWRRMTSFSANAEHFRARNAWSLKPFSTGNAVRNHQARAGGDLRSQEDNRWRRRWSLKFYQSGQKGFNRSVGINWRPIGPKT